MNILAQSVQRKPLFFQKIKVQQSSTIAGQTPEYEKYQDCVGWRYTSKKMRSFGIDQVRFKQVLWLPKSSYKINLFSQFA